MGSCVSGTGNSKTGLSMAMGVAKCKKKAKELVYDLNLKDLFSKCRIEK